MIHLSTFKRQQSQQPVFTMSILWQHATAVCEPGCCARLSYPLSAFLTIVTACAAQEPFELTRTASKSKSSLKLIVAGQDLTQQEQRLTEAELEARFSASLLPKTLVFTQEDLLELLQVCLVQQQ